MVGVDKGEELLDDLWLGVLELHHPQLILLHVVGEHGAEHVGARSQHEFVAREVLYRIRKVVASIESQPVLEIKLVFDIRILF